MKAIVRYKDPTKGFNLIEVPKPKVSPKYIIVKVMASSVNPSDVGFCHGYYPMDFPESSEYRCCGFEGSGEVVEIGEGVPEEYLGKKVACITTVGNINETFGMWAEYAKIHYKCVNILPNDITYEEGACFYINPITIIAMVDDVKKAGLKSFVHTAAASSLGKMLVKYCKKVDLNCICIVRKKTQEETLTKLGAKYILDSTAPDFAEKLKGLTKELDAKLAFDAVGGDLTAILAKNLPQGSKIFIYGVMGGNFKGFDPGTLIFRDITIAGYHLKRTETGSSISKTMEALELIQKDLATDKIFVTEIGSKFPISQYMDIFNNYKSLCSAGKPLITPNVIEKIEKPYPRALSHFSISVPNIEKAIKFYQDVFNWVLLKGPIVVKEDKSSEMGVLMSFTIGEGFKELKVAYLTTGEGIGVEFFEFSQSLNQPNKYDFWKTGIFHISVRTPQIEETSKKLIEHGGKAKSKIHNITTDGKYKMQYVEDPFGNVIELFCGSYEVLA